ncbi:MAG: hypothetical protein ACI8XM_000304 [Haloarculaceae archaeon]|jgi:hypothetical protein
MQNSSIMQRTADPSADPLREAQRIAIRLIVVLGGLIGSVGIAAAHGGGLAGAQPERLAVPTWLFLTTGGSVIGVSFLLASFVTDRELIAYAHSEWQTLRTPEGVLRRAGQLLGVVGLGAVLVTGFVGSTEALRNPAILIVWAGWWAGYTMTIYLLGNSWPALNPFRTLTQPLGDGVVEYPSRLNRWPSVVGLLAIIWIEVVSPLADDPRLLATMISGYLGVTVIGAVLFGSETWFEHVDPVSNVFRQYGKVAPIQRTENGLSLVTPGTRLSTDPADDWSEVGLIIALVWGTTYDGFVSTPLWSDLAPSIVALGVPPVVLYPLVLALGFCLFGGAYWGAIRYARRLAPTHLAPEAIARLFAPSLLAIAAGYHLAHYLSYFLTVSPALFATILNPLGGGTPAALVLPSWFPGLAIAFVLLGHLLAIWVAHSVAYERFPSKLQAIRSQYSLTLVMIAYTMVSLWIVTQPFAAPPYL